APSAVSVWVAPLGSTSRTAEPNERTAGSSHGPGVGVAVVLVRVAVGVGVAVTPVGVGVTPVGVGFGVGQAMPASATSTLPSASNAIFTGLSSSALVES